jgi:V8-like Glu-specific endopeptidase
MTARGQAAADLASVAVFGAGPGSGVLVGERWLVTARHVLETTTGPTSGGLEEVEIVVEVKFPHLGTGELLPTRALHPTGFLAGRGGSDRGSPVDVALLELVDPVPQWLPPAMALWAPGREPDRVDVFGFPVDETELVGWWRSFEVAGPVDGGTKVQLRWLEDVGTLPGHSGGPVLDAATGALAGILVEGAVRGRFDRYVPIRVAHSLWPQQLPRPWLVVGGEGRDHFERRALGQRSSRGEEDLFRGRGAALDKARRWMTDPLPPGAPLVITGQPGAGKSAVLARTALQELEVNGYGPGLAFHARGATHDELLDALGALAGAAKKPTRPEVLDALDRPADRESSRWFVAVDALDEASSDIVELARTLREVAELDSVRLVVATRRRAAIEITAAGVPPDGLGTLLAELAVAADNLIDLDSDDYFDPAGLVDYVGALLQRKGPRGRAWQTYRVNASLRGRLAHVVAQRADRNYLVAVMAADPLSRHDIVVDPADPGFDPERIPSSVGDALETYLDAIQDEDRRERRRTLLTALAYARGNGLDDQLWLAFADSLGYRPSRADLDGLRASAAADYLLQSSWSVAGGRRVVRLFHQALADQLLQERDRAADHAALVQLIHPLVHAESAVARTYARTRLAEHAVAAGQLSQVLRDPDYVLHADLSRVRPLLRHPSVRGDAVARVLRRAAARAEPLAPDQRAMLLALAAAYLQLPHLVELYGRHCPLRIRWAHAEAQEHEELLGHTESVNTVALGRLTDGRDVLASGGSDGMVRLWDPVLGTELRTLVGHTDSVNALAFARLHDGRELLASAGSDGIVRLWDPVLGTELRTLVGHTGSVNALAFARLHDGRDLLASGGSVGRSWDGAVCLWDPATGILQRTLTGYIDRVSTVAFTRLIDGRDILASGSNVTVRLWDPSTGTELATHDLTDLDGHAVGVSSVAFTRLSDGRDLLAGASGQLDGTVRLWAPCTGTELAAMTGNTLSVRAVAFARLADGRDLLVSAGEDRTVRLWDPTTGTELATMSGHDGGVNSVAVGRFVDGRDVLVPRQATLGR